MRLTENTFKIFLDVFCCCNFTYLSIIINLQMGGNSTYNLFGTKYLHQDG